MQTTNDAVTAAETPQNFGVSVAEIVPSARKLNFFALVAIIFFTVSGGAFGIEPLIGKMGAGWAIFLILLTPVLWCLPIVLMVSELSSAMPE